MPPWPVKAWVTQQDPDNYGVFVCLFGPLGGQGPTLSVQVLTHGPRDGVAGRFPALPTAGTHGLVVFSSGDERNGVWLGAISTQFTDADAHAPGNGAADYAAHYGGGWSWRGQDGTVAEVLPDGTVIQLGPVLPAPTRHTVAADQSRQRTPWPVAQRVAQAVGAFPLSITSPNGASAVLGASGGWQITAASGQAVSLSVAGGASFTLSGATLTVGSDTTVNIASSSAINLTAPAISATNGGAAIAVQLANSTSSTVFKAQ